MMFNSFTNNFYEIHSVANEKATVEVCEMRLHLKPFASLDDRQQLNHSHKLSVVSGGFLYYIHTNL